MITVLRFHLSYIYLYQNNADSAYFYLKEGLETAPDDVELNYYFGTALLKLGKFDESIKAAESHPVLKSKIRRCIFQSCRSIFQQRGCDNGLLCYLKVIELNPENEAYYSAAINFWKSKGDTLKAKEYFDKAAATGI